MRHCGSRLSHAVAHQATRGPTVESVLMNFERHFKSLDSNWRVAAALMSSSDTREIMQSLLVHAGSFRPHERCPQRITRYRPSLSVNSFCRSPVADFDQSRIGLDLGLGRSAIRRNRANVTRVKRPAHGLSQSIWRPTHSGWPRCSAVTCEQYAPSSRLARRRLARDLRATWPCAGLSSTCGSKSRTGTRERCGETSEWRRVQANVRDLRHFHARR